MLPLVPVLPLLPARVVRVVHAPVGPVCSFLRCLAGALVVALAVVALAVVALVVAPVVVQTGAVPPNVWRACGYLAPFLGPAASLLYCAVSATLNGGRAWPAIPASTHRSFRCRW